MANPLEESYGRTRGAAPRIMPNQNQETTTTVTQPAIKKEEAPAIRKDILNDTNRWGVVKNEYAPKENNVSTPSHPPKLTQTKESDLLSSLKQRTPQAFNGQFTFRLGEIELTTPSGKDILVNVQQELNDLVGNKNIDKTMLVKYLIAKSILIEKGEWK